jgi:beta-lactamase regulating signal transducer with metallopeptidase domain
MSGLVDALLLGAGFSLVSGLVLWPILSRMPAGPGAAIHWRMARWVSVLPLILAPMIHFIPEAPASAAAQAAPLHASLPLAWPAAELPAASSLTTSGFAWSWLAGLYLAGLVVSLGLAARRHLRRRSFLKRCRWPESSEQDRIETAAGAVTAAEARVLISPRIASPVLTGWWGVIVLPEALLSDQRALRFALVHERVHHNRGDERDRLVGAALTTIFWFHLPLRWIERELGAAREIACDAETLNVLGSTQRSAYASTLIDTMRQAIPAASAFGPQDRRHRKMRIKAIMGEGRPSHLRSILLTATTLSIAVPLAAAQAAWTDRVETVQPVQQVEAVAGIAPEPEEMPFGELAFAPEAAMEPAPEPQEVSFGAADAAAPFINAPVSGGRVSSRFGPRPDMPASAPPFHNGTDVAAPEGTPISAPAAGRVVHAANGFNGNEAWGNTVAIDHGEGWQTVYAHMQGFDVAVGDTVRAGQQIGRVGTTGRSTGPHVHVEVRRNGEQVDPGEFVPGLR